MPTRTELKALAALRLKEAEVRFDAGCYDGAAYLAGYVIELALKARICRLLGVQNYPDEGVYRTAYAVHRFDQLLFLAGLRKKLRSNVPVLANWSIAVPWGPEFRYFPPGTISHQEALASLNAIRDPEHGVFRWIKKHW